MNKELSSLCKELFREAMERRVPVSKLSKLKKKMESGSDSSEIIPSLIREIEIRILSIKEEQERKTSLARLDMRREQFLEFREEGARRRGK